MKMFCLTVGSSTIYVNADYYEISFNNMIFYKFGDEYVPASDAVAVFPANLIECVYVDDAESVITYRCDFEKE